MSEQPGQAMQEESLPRFGNYDLVRRIDVGGMGEVYLAHQRSAFYAGFLHLYDRNFENEAANARTDHL